MAWVAIPGLPGWEYDNAPPDPGADSPERPLWLKQTNGVRDFRGRETYTRTRRTGDGDISRGEISKTYWDLRAP